MPDALNKVVDYCAENIINVPKRPLFVGVTGDSGSGKSFLVSLIAEKLKGQGLSVTVINHDDFLISRQAREPMKSVFYEDGPYAGKSHWELLENMFRLDEFESVISDMKAGKSASYRPYSRKTGTVSDAAVKVEASDINIFDSSMMVEHMDYVIMVDVTQENIIQRKLQRDADIRTPDEIVDMHKRVQGYYWERRKPKSADIVIDNNVFSDIHVAYCSK